MFTCIYTSNSLYKLGVVHFQRAMKDAVVQYDILLLGDDRDFNVQKGRVAAKEDEKTD